MSRFLELHNVHCDGEPTWVAIAQISCLRGITPDDRARDARSLVEMVDGRPLYVTETPAEILALSEAAEQGYVEPEECRQHRCSYYTHYLVYGGPDLTHDGFHAAEEQASQHISNCTHNWENGPCPTCARWEARVRA